MNSIWVRVLPGPMHLGPNDLVYVITTCRDYTTARSSHCTSFNLRFNLL